MDTIAITRLVEELIKDFETSETHSILFYSQDQSRDFRLLMKRVKDYRNRLSTLLAENGEQHIRETGDSVRTEDISA